MTPQRFLSICLWGILGLVILPLYLNIALNDPVDYMRGGMGARDFKAYYVAAKLLDQAKDIYDPNLQKQEMQDLSLPEDDTLYIYPIGFALAIIPLTHLSLQDAARTWNLFNVILVGASLVLITRALGLGRHSRTFVSLFYILVLLSYPTILSVRAGQTNVLLLFFLVLTLFASMKNQQAAAGAALAVPILTKIFALGFLAWLLWRRQYRAVIWCGVATVGILITSNLALLVTGRGTSSDIEYFTRVLPDLAATTLNVDIQSLQATGGTTVSSVWVLLGNYSLNGFLARLGLSSSATKLLTILFSVILIVVTCVRMFRSDRELTAALGFAALLALLLLVSTITWESTLVLLAVPFGILLKAWVTQERPRGLAIILVAALVLLNTGRLWGAFDTTILITAPWLISSPFIGAVLIWVACVSQMRVGNQELG